MKIGFIGSSKISQFHISALRNNGFEIIGIGTRENSINCEKFARENFLIDYFCKKGWEEVIEKEVDAYCVCIDTTYTPEILLRVLDKGKPVLVEKPIAWELSKLEPIIKHKNVSKIFVGYNRRFYRVVNIAKEFAKESRGGTVYINIPDSKIGSKRFISNGCHMVDLARYIFGDFKINNKIKISNDSGEMAYLTAFCSNKKWTITINAHSLIPANFSITINSGKNVFELSPIEKYSLFEGLEIIEPHENFPLRRYVPKVIQSEFEDAKFKPGFNEMYRQFKKFILGSCIYTQNIIDVNQAYLTLEKCYELIK